MKTAIHKNGSKGNLQYKMFLLNKKTGLWILKKDTFTIQNVPIKYKLMHTQVRVHKYLQYKMFLLNRIKSFTVSINQ